MGPHLRPRALGRGARSLVAHSLCCQPLWRCGSRSSGLHSHAVAQRLCPGRQAGTQGQVGLQLAPAPPSAVLSDWLQGHSAPHRERKSRLLGRRLAILVLSRSGHTSAAGRAASESTVPSSVAAVFGVSAEAAVAARSFTDHRPGLTPGTATILPLSERRKGAYANNL